jgi:hypothetical protein
MYFLNFSKYLLAFLGCWSKLFFNFKFQILLTKNDIYKSQCFLLFNSKYALLRKWKAFVTCLHIDLLFFDPTTTMNTYSQDCFLWFYRFFSIIIIICVTGSREWGANSGLHICSTGTLSLSHTFQHSALGILKVESLMNWAGLESQFSQSQPPK